MTFENYIYPLIPAKAGIQFETARHTLWIPNQVWDERKAEK